MNYTEIINNVCLITNSDNRELIEVLAKKAYLSVGRMIGQLTDYEIGLEVIVGDILQDIVIYYLNRLPRLGIDSESVAGFSFNYSSLPKDILENIDALCVTVTGGHINTNSTIKKAYDGWNIWR